MTCQNTTSSRLPTGRVSLPFLNPLQYRIFPPRRPSLVRQPCSDGLLPQALEILRIGLVELLEDRTGAPRSASTTSCGHNLRPKHWVLPINVLGVAFGVLGVLLSAAWLVFLLPILSDLMEGSRELGQARIWIQGGVIVEEVDSLLNRAGVRLGKITRRLTLTRFVPGT